VEYGRLDMRLTVIQAHRLAVDGIWTRGVRTEERITFTVNERWRIIVLTIGQVTIMTHDRKRIPAMHLYRLRVMLHMNMLFVGQLRPVGVTGKRRFDGMTFEVNFVCLRLLVLIQFLEKRTPVVELRERGRMLPVVGAFDGMCLWDDRIVMGMICKNILSMIDIEWLLKICRSVGMHFV
jgi:hypothetical protein